MSHSGSLLYFQSLAHSKCVVSITCLLNRKVLNDEKIMILVQAMRIFWRKEEEEEESGIFRLSVVTSPLFLIKSGSGSPSG